jgi:hypothetical protein
VEHLFKPSSAMGVQEAFGPLKYDHPPYHYPLLVGYELLSLRSSQSSIFIISSTKMKAIRRPLFFLSPLPGLPFLVLSACHHLPIESVNPVPTH